MTTRTNKESKYAYVRQQCDGWYKVTNNGQVVIEDTDWQTAQRVAEQFGKKVKMVYDF